MKFNIAVPLACLSLTAGTVIGTSVRAQEAPARLTPAVLLAALAAKPDGAQAEQLIGQIREAFGGPENLQNGPAPIVDQRTVAWAVEVPSLANAPVEAPTPARGRATGPRVVDDSGPFTVPLTRVGSSGVYAGVKKFSSGTAMTWHYEAAGRRFGGGPLEVYEDHPDSREKPGVPKGTVKAMGVWNSKIFPGTVRNWWIYVPAQYRPEQPAAVMVFQDGSGHTALADPKIYVPTVFDNLIARGDMPATAAIFIQPGTLTDGDRQNRSFEYDTLSDQYVRFLTEEILPEAEKTVKLRHDPESRAITGYSSGAIASFTAAWERPNEFGKVLTWVGSFSNLAAGQSGREGAHNYPALIRRTPPKPIRIFMQDGSRDAENQAGSWSLGNQEIAEALQFAGYDYRFVTGEGFHSDKHGRSIFPDSLRWLWRDYPKD